MKPSAAFPTSSRGLGEKIRFHLRSRFAAPWVRDLRRRAPLMADLPAGNLVVIAPHPDDETLGCGGLIALKRLRGEHVHVVFLTSGENSLAGHPRVTPPALAARRENEAIAALRMLGVAEGAVEFLRAGDGELTSAAQQPDAPVLAALARIIANQRPAIVTTPFRLDGHPDHESAYALTREAVGLAASAAQIWEYPVWSLWMLTRSQTRLPDFQKFIRLDVGSVLAAKKQALACHVTQVAPVAPWPRPTLSGRFADRLLDRYELFRRPAIRR